MLLNATGVFDKWMLNNNNNKWQRMCVVHILKFIVQNCRWPTKKWKNGFFFVVSVFFSKEQTTVFCFLGFFFLTKKRDPRPHYIHRYSKTCNGNRPFWRTKSLFQDVRQSNHWWEERNPLLFHRGHWMFPTVRFNGVCDWWFWWGSFSLLFSLCVSSSLLSVTIPAFLNRRLHQRLPRRTCRSAHRPWFSLLPMIPFKPWFKTTTDTLLGSRQLQNREVLRSCNPQRHQAKISSFSQSQKTTVWPRAQTVFSLVQRVAHVWQWTRQHILWSASRALERLVTRLRIGSLWTKWQRSRRILSGLWIATETNTWPAPPWPMEPFKPTLWHQRAWTHPMIFMFGDKHRDCNPVFFKKKTKFIKQAFVQQDIITSSNDTFTLKSDIEIMMWGKEKQMVAKVENINTSSRWIWRGSSLVNFFHHWNFSLVLTVIFFLLFFLTVDVVSLVFVVLVIFILAIFVITVLFWMDFSSSIVRVVSGRRNGFAFSTFVDLLLFGGDEFKKFSELEVFHDIRGQQTTKSFSLGTGQQTTGWAMSPLAETTRVFHEMITARNSVAWRTVLQACFCQTLGRAVEATRKYLELRGENVLSVASLASKRSQNDVCFKWLRVFRRDFVLRNSSSNSNIPVFVVSDRFCLFALVFFPQFQPNDRVRKKTNGADK